MPRPKLYPLKDYIKAAEKLAAKKGLRLEVTPGKGSAVRFDVFMAGEIEPWEIWAVHTSHTKKREIWSKEDYKKPDRCLGLEPGTFLKEIASL